MGISGTSILTRLNPRSVSRPVSSRPAACLCRVRSPASSERSSLSSAATRSPWLFITTSSSFVMKSRSCLAALVIADRFSRIATAMLIIRPFAAADGAAGAVLDFGFEERELADIYAGADPPNAASFRVIEKLGMKFPRKTYLNPIANPPYITHQDHHTY